MVHVIKELPTWNEMPKDMCNTWICLALTPVLSNNSPHGYAAKSSSTHSEHSASNFARLPLQFLAAGSMDKRLAVCVSSSQSQLHTGRVRVEPELHRLLCQSWAPLHSTQSRGSRPKSRSSRRRALDVQLEDWQNSKRRQDCAARVSAAGAPLRAGGLPAQAAWPCAIAITVSLWYRSGLSAVVVTPKANQKFSKQEKDLRYLQINIIKTLTV